MENIRRKVQINDENSQHNLIHFSFTFDEETACQGAPILIKELKKREIKDGICIVGEPTNMKIIDAHKGCYEYTTYFKGLAGHSSTPHKGVSAVEYASRYVNKLIELLNQNSFNDFNLKVYQKQKFFFINGSGATTLMELLIIYKDVEEYLSKYKINCFKPLVNEYITTQESAGFSISLLRSSEQMRDLWTAPCSAPYFHL